MAAILLPADHPRIRKVEPAEELLRTFAKDENQADITVVDEGATPSRCLRGGALRFDADGCSTSRAEILRLARVDKAVLISPPRYVWMAATTVGAVEDHEQTIDSGAVIRPFGVVADPYPGGDGEPKAAAHALIQLRHDFPSNTKRRLAIDTLAKRAFLAPVSMA